MRCSTRLCHCTSVISTTPTGCAAAIHHGCRNLTASTARTPTATLIAAGPCSIIASQAGNGDWFAAPSVTLGFTIKPARGNQTIAFPPPAATALDAGPASLAASASSGLAVSYTSLTPAVCTTSGNHASLIATGTCTVQASQPGDDHWLGATPVNASFAITAANASNPGDGDVPLPGWALASLAAALAGRVMRRRF